MISIIIAYHNDGAILNECIKSIAQKTGAPYELIVVDDCSDTPLKLKGAKVIRHEKNLGVGAAFDTGVAHAKYDNVILTAPDITIQTKGWDRVMIEELNDNQTSLICATCVGKRNYYGATIVPFHEKHRNIVAAKWKSEYTREVPAILGAFYGVKKWWYTYIDGFWGHRQWGSLESYISLKNWMFGGKNLCLDKIQAVHKFGRHNKRIRRRNIIFNRMLIARLLIEDWREYFEYMGTDQDVDLAWGMIEKMDLKAKIKEYKSKKYRDIEQFYKKFGLNGRTEESRISDRRDG